MESLDIRILLEFLCPLENENLSQIPVSAQLASLESLAEMCTNTKAAQNLRDLKALKVIWRLCCCSDNLQVTRACFFTLACIAQSDVYAQQELSCKDVFSYVNALLEGKDIALKTQILGTYFLLTLVSKNKQGQNLIYTSGCLDSLMKLFVKHSEILDSASKIINDNTFEIWNVIVKTLSYAVNVPQNDQNQVKVSKIMPWIINLIHKRKPHLHTSGILCTFLSVLVENNVKSQQVALSCRSVEVLIIFLNHLLKIKYSSCAGDAITALRHILPSKGEYWQKFVSFGGPSLLVRLLDEFSSKQWLPYHIYETLTLVSQCTATSDVNFERENSDVARIIVNLLQNMSGDQCFSEIAVKLVNFFLSSDHFPKQLKNFNSKKSRLKNNVETAKGCLDEWHGTVPQQMQLTSHKNKKRVEQYSKKLYECTLEENQTRTLTSHSTIEVKTQSTGVEVVLDISNSTRDALRKSAGISELPTECATLRYFDSGNSSYNAEIKQNKQLNYPKYTGMPSLYFENDASRSLEKLRFQKPSYECKRGMKSNLSANRKYGNQYVSPFHMQMKSHPTRKSKPRRCKTVKKYAAVRANNNYMSMLKLGHLSAKKNVYNRSYDSDDIVSICSDLIEDEVHRTAMKCKFLPQSGYGGTLQFRR